MSKIIRAVAGVLVVEQTVLITSRPHNRSYAGYWEFPGGKIEAQETAKQALVRELHEELGIIVDKNNIRHIIYIKEPYPTHQVQLDVMLVDKWQLIPQAREEQQLHWQMLTAPCNLTPQLPTTDKILTILREY